MPKRTKPLDPSLAGMPARVRQAREALGLGVRELGDLSGIKVAGVSRIERGQRIAGLSISTVLALAQALRVHVEWLMTGQGPMRTDGRFVVLELTPELLEAVRKSPAQLPAANAVGSDR